MRLDDNAGGLTEVDIEESTDVTAVDGDEPGKSWTLRGCDIHFSGLADSWNRHCQLC